MHGAELLVLVSVVYVTGGTATFWVAAVKWEQNGPEAFFFGVIWPFAALITGIMAAGLRFFTGLDNAAAHFRANERTRQARIALTKHEVRALEEPDPYEEAARAELAKDLARRNEWR